MVIKGNSIIVSCLQCRGITCITLNFLCPVIRLFYNLELNGNIRTADLIQLDFNKEERNIIIGMIIQPFDSRAMFFSCSLYNPNHDISRFPGCICDKLSQTVMVRILKLILDDIFSVCSGFCCVDIHIEVTNTGLRLINGYLQSNSICQQGKNIVFRKLRSKVQCFMRPDFS